MTGVYVEIAADKLMQGMYLEHSLCYDGEKPDEWGGAALCLLIPTQLFYDAYIVR